MKRVGRGVPVVTQCNSVVSVDKAFAFFILYKEREGWDELGSLLTPNSTISTTHFLDLVFRSISLMDSRIISRLPPGEPGSSLSSHCHSHIVLMLNTVCRGKSPDVVQWF